METERDVCLIDLGDAGLETRTPLGALYDGFPVRGDPGI